MRLTLLQMKVADGDPQTNLHHAEEMIRSEPGSDLYLLPEVWTTGYDRSSWRNYVDNIHFEVISSLTHLAQETNSCIGGTYIARKGPHELVNRFLLISGEWDFETYDKIHLFEPLEEDKYLTPGEKPVQTKIKEWNVGLSICYDLRFPNMYRASALEGTTLFLVPSQWPAVRCHQMVVLAQARAIENQSYVALCNRIGTAQNGLHFGGRSGIWGPDGTLLADAGDKEGIITAEIDLDHVKKYRQEFPVLQPSLV